MADATASATPDAHLGTPGGPRKWLCKPGTGVGRRRRRARGPLGYIPFRQAEIILAAIGIYGVISYGVCQRTTELAIRASFGATPPMVLRLAMKQCLILAGGGVVAGVVLASFGRQLVASQLSEVSTSDPPRSWEDRRS